MTQNVQISTKLADGTILVLGGQDAEEFYSVATNMIGASAAEELTSLFMNLVPTSAPAPRAAQPTSQPRQAQSATPPGGTNCPTHGQPAEHISSAKGEFWKCPVNGTFINNYNAPGFKSACPAPKG